MQPGSFGDRSHVKLQEIKARDVPFNTKSLRLPAFSMTLCCKDNPWQDTVPYRVYNSFLYTLLQNSVKLPTSEDRFDSKQPHLMPRRRVGGQQ